MQMDQLKSQEEKIERNMMKDSLNHIKQDLQQMVRKQEMLANKGCPPPPEVSLPLSVVTLFFLFIMSFSGLLRLLNFLHLCYNAPGRPDRFHHLLQDVTRSCCEKVLLKWSGPKQGPTVFPVRLSIFNHLFFKRLDTNQTYFYSSNFQRVKLWAHIISVLYLLKGIYRIYDVISVASGRHDVMNAKKPSK